MSLLVLILVSSFLWWYLGCLLTSFEPGHNGISRDGSFGGPRNDDAIIDFAYRALHLTTVAAKSLASQYYGYNHTKSYYMACSTGGRQGIKAMSSFPEDYDGVV
jgi:feruloyl esterase